MIEILQNSTLIYTDGMEEQFEALRLTKRGIYIGRILRSGGKERYFECGFISKDNVKSVIGGKKRIIEQI